MKPEHEGLFEAALAAYDVGDKPTAQRLVAQILKADDHAAEAWLLLSYLVTNWYDQMQCAENALSADPASADAQQRAAQLKAARIPDSHLVRTHTRIPALAEAHASTMDEYFQSSKLESATDPLDDPHQCPYCAVPNASQRNTCHACGKSLMRVRKPQKLATPGLRLALLLNFGSMVLLLLQLLPPTLWAWYARIEDGTRLKWTMDTIFEQRPAVLVAGDFTQVLTPTLFVVLVGAGAIRLVLLIVANAGMRLRITGAYYIGLGVFVVEVLWAALAMGLGWTGIFVGAASVLLAGAGLMALGTAAVNFRVTTERYIVRPDVKLKSGHAYWEAGKDYQRRGMWAMAVTNYRAAVAAAPNRANHYKSLGIGYNKLGRTDRALTTLEQALRLDPTDSETAVLVKRIKKAQAAGPGSGG
jgi:tetratricopeptide (TPR) repeat protein